jgi:Ras-related GTP-binding protein A/B
VDVEHTHVRFLGNLVLNLWDCGGQFRFYENYFDSQRDTIFRNVEVLIYVFDIDSGDLENDIILFDGIIEAMEQNSPDAAVFILIHKMDLIAEEDRDRAYSERAVLIQSRSTQ